MSPNELWRFLPLGYLLTILIETPILVVGLSRPHPLKRKLFAGVWLTACTYPIVVLVLPLLFAPDHRVSYLLVAETFAPVAECVLFWLAFGKLEEAGTRSMWRDFIAIIVANLASFGIGEVINASEWFGLMG
jgi:lipopolysaccharide export LptBFGC system permease protein LptF